MGNRFVVTVLGALACSSKGPEVITHNPPAPDPVPAPEPVPAPVPEPEPISKDRAMLNALDPQGRTIFRGQDGNCYIQLPPPPPAPGAPVASFRPPVREVVDCPTSMKAAGWENCVGGTLRKGESGEDCMCAVLGNPPPPPRVVACPTPEG